jgi:hypothetical protein
MSRLATALVAATICFATAVRADAPPAAASSPPAQAATATATPNAPAARPAAAGGLTDVEIKRAFAKFKKQERDGSTVYCRREAPLGSRLGKTVCYSEEQVLVNARAERDAGRMQSQQNVCGIGSCSPGAGT